MAKNTAREDAMLQIKRLWNQACEYDRIPVDSKFVVFSEHNPYFEAYQRAMTEYMRGFRVQRSIELQ